MLADEFRQLLTGRTDEDWCAFFDVGAATLRRWKTGKARIPGAVDRLIRLYPVGHKPARNLPGEDADMTPVQAVKLATALLAAASECEAQEKPAEFPYAIKRSYII
jgi:hypothetical protein